MGIFNSQNTRRNQLRRLHSPQRDRPAGRETGLFAQKRQDSFREMMEIAPEAARKSLG